jgi:uncharacterized protein (DUF1015 family)
LAKIYAFPALRYTAKAGRLDDLVTQPYDKISPAMRERYLGLSPHNIVRVILPGREPDDYRRAAQDLSEWISQGILACDAEPGIFAYFQEFTVPDTGERLLRKGFVALGAVEEYSANVVFRHEQTLSGPKKDRLELLRATHTHLGQLFMLYPDKAGEIDALLDQAAKGSPLAEVTDEYGAVHRLWRVADPAPVQQLMSDKKLLIADGHHRYETALAFRNENPKLAGADRVMMTFVNMYSPGLKILATHRLVNNIRMTGFPQLFLTGATAGFNVEELDSLDALKNAWSAAGDRSIIAAAIGGKLYRMEHRSARGALDVRILHEQILSQLLGIGEEAVRDEKHIRYVRGLEPAVEEARRGTAQVAFLLKPTSVEQVAEISFGGGVMPQKSTDFYPKLLTGLVNYKID